MIYQTVKPYTEHIDSMLNEIKLHSEFIFIEVPYMNSRKFELLITLNNFLSNVILSEQVESYL